MLPLNVLCTSFDYGGNMLCAPKSHPHSGSIFELSIMSGYEVSNVDGQLQNNAVITLSNQSAHGWHGAVPGYKNYIQMKKREFRARGIILATIISLGDNSTNCHLYLYFSGDALNADVK